MCSSLHTAQLQLLFRDFIINHLAANTFKFAGSNMYELFFQKFNEKVTLTKEEQEVIINFLTPKKIRKRQYLLQEGDICKIVAFVEKGALRGYSLDENGLLMYHLSIPIMSNVMNIFAQQISLKLKSIQTSSSHLPK